MKSLQVVHRYLQATRASEGHVVQIENLNNHAALPGPKFFFHIFAITGYPPLAFPFNR